MLGKAFKSLLEGLDLLSNEAVFFRDEKNGKIFMSFSAETQKKLYIIKPDAYFVFNNQPYILFFDLSGNANSQRETEIHKQVWSFDNSPIIFIVKDNEVQIFNAFSFEKKNNRLQEIQISENERNERFSFWNLQSGEAWKWLQAEHYGTTIQKKRVNQKLFENIRLVREILINPDGIYILSEDEANILILRLIFIRYLIDRDVKMDESFIEGKTVAEKRKSFIELIEKPTKLNQFFEQLNNKFNGVLFKDMNVQLKKEQAVELSRIFNDRPKSSQLGLFDSFDFYFEIFDFGIIPVEVISGIYESLINLETRSEQSAVYTPAFLVEYILTSTIDTFLEENTTSECKVFDPSCGSGIFLVQSYRRMVDKEQMLYGEKIKKTRLKEIAQKNLFGIDVNRQALKVTCFSIYIAILDYQDPKTILGNFHFPKLIDENFFEANFFDTHNAFNEVLISVQPNFILGNPPWKSNKDEIHLKWLKDNNKTTGRFEIAQSFLLRSKDFMVADTKAALIVTSTIFYNISKTTKQFKKDFLTQFCLNGFFDLSPVRRLIFEEKNNPAAIVYYKLSDGNNHMINVVHHESIKSNIFLKYYKTLIIEKFDQKKILQRHFIENDWMFKVALYGNTLDFFLIKKINSLRDLRVIDLVDGKSLYKGAGIERGKDPKPFPDLIGMSVIENEDIKANFLALPSDIKILSEEDVILSRGRDKNIFLGHKIIFKEQTYNESEPLIAYSKDDVVFRKGVFSLASKNEGSIKILYGFFKSNLSIYYLYLISAAWGVATRPAIRFEEEFLSLPFIVTNDETKSELIDLVSAYLQLFEEYYKSILRLEQSPNSNSILSDINRIVNSVFQISGYENDLVDYVLNVSRYQFQESKQHKFTKKIDNDEAFLKRYADVFIQELQSIYEDEQMTIEVYNLDHFVAMNFVFTENTLFNDTEMGKIVFISHSNNEKDILQRIASNLSISKFMSSTDPTKNIYIQKDIKGFEENSFYIIKPNEYKCWHRAMAWYDVAEIKETIEQAEQNHLKAST